MLNVKLTSRLRVVGTIKDIENKLAGPLAASGTLVQEEAKVALGNQGEDSTPGDSWPAYFSKKLRKWTTASTPPAPPRRQTGQLQDSLKRIFGRKDTIHIAATAPYAADLEYGRKKMAGPRPFMRPSLFMALPKIARAFYHFLSR